MASQSDMPAANQLNISVCNPLKTYAEVLEWSPVAVPWENKAISLQPRSKHNLRGSKQTCHDFKSTWKQPLRYERNSTPKTLFCHDLKGGYLEDRFVAGSTQHNEYRFFHWSSIDIFVYFSHHLVTIPPPAWINAGHLHGVKVLGTLITEWDEGKAVWDQILETDQSLQTFVDCLVKICVHFGFDGYLLNVENKLEPDQIPKLKTFVKLLHTELHKQVPNAELIWYDSVTVEGKLKWQNELNDLNRSFFDSCDGIFLNYTWSEKSLHTSVTYAGVRMLDVYVGVDVFGRNCYSGGGFNTWEALKLIQEYNLSLALFAPGWVHETLDQDHFICLEYIFWKRLWRYLYIHGPSSLPFSTSFCQGYGKKLYHNGEVIGDQPWYNLSKQQYQPSVCSCINECCMERSSKPKDEAEKGEPGPAPKEHCCDKINKGCVQHYSKDAFIGGGCLEIQRLRLQQTPEDLYFHRLLMCDFSCEGKVIISFATKENDEDVTNLNLMLLIEENTGNYRMKMLYALRTCGVVITEEDQVYALEPEEVDELKERVPLITTPTSGEEARDSWIMRHFMLHINGRILEVGANLTCIGNSILLGYLSIIPLDS